MVGQRCGVAALITVVLVAIVALSVSPPGRTAAERQEMARIVAGECPVGLMGQDAAIAVAWTIRNRLADGAPFRRVTRAYYGRKRPTSVERTIVDLVLAADADDDPTGGAKWVMSRQDRETWGFRVGDLIFEAEGRPQYQIHVYRKSPFNR